MQDPLAGAHVIAPSLGRHFSGINATLIAVVPVIARRFPIVATGFHLTPSVPQVPLGVALPALRRGSWRIWHARRNIEMLVGLFLRHVLRYPLILLWTSAAQRRHTWLTRFCYRRMDRVIATTRAAAGYLSVPAQVVYHGVDLTVYQPPANRTEARRGKDLPARWNLGVFGRIRPQKGTGDLVRALIEVLPRHPDWGAVFIGQVTKEYQVYARGLERELAAAGLAKRVRFHGFVPDFGEIPDWYRAMDWVVCASRNEGFGVTCLEAMASGCPVVATRAGAWPEIVAEGQDGWLARAADPPDLARALEKALATDTDQRLEMGRRARDKVVGQFAIKMEADGLIAVYQALLQRRGALRNLA